MFFGRYQLHDIIEWLAGNECHELDDAGLVAGLGRRLQGAGLPVDRLTLHLRTLHPELLGRSIAWSADSPVEVCDRERGLQKSAIIARSPVLHVMNHRQWLVVRLGDPRFPDWPQLDVFRDRGLTEIVIAPLLNGDGPASAAVFCTRTAGFSDAEQRALAGVVPALRNACEVRLLRQAETTLLNTYVGTASGRRILAGHIQRGDVETLE